jgi:hypothetical protein
MSEVEQIIIDKQEYNNLKEDLTELLEENNLFRKILLNLIFECDKEIQDKVKNCLVEKQLQEIINDN